MVGVEPLGFQIIQLAQHLTESGPEAKFFEACGGMRSLYLFQWRLSPCSIVQKIIFFRASKFAAKLSKGSQRTELGCG